MVLAVLSPSDNIAKYRGESMSKNQLNIEERRLKRNNLLVAALLGAIALAGVLVPLFYYTGLVVPK